MADNNSDLTIPSTKKGEREATDSQTALVHVYTSAKFPTLPADILRLSFEAAIARESESNNDQHRQRTAYACCLVSKEVKAWIEPVLYVKVVLESSKQVMGFLLALETKPAQFLASAVKTVWILDNSFHADEVNRFHRLFSICLSLKQLAVIGLEPCTRILQDVPKPQSGTYALRDLVIIQADSASAHRVSLSNLSIHRLQVIDASENFIASLKARAIADNKFVDELRAISQICFDSTSVPTFLFTHWVKEDIIPLLLLQNPGTTTRISLRSSSDRPHLKHLHRWVKGFDAYISQCGGRLLVRANPEVGSITKRPRKRSRSQDCTGSDPVASEYEQAKDWIGLE